MEQSLISKIVRRKRRTLALHIAPDASLVVRAPRMVSEETIRRVVQAKMPWILEKQRLARKTFRPPVKYVDGERFLYLGKWHKLLVVPGASAPLVFNQNEFLLSGQCLPKANEMFKTWYKKKALAIINNRVKQYAETTGLKYTRISITNAKKRWGSCSVRGNLNFSWRLIMTPLTVVDYVIVHELTHLEEHNHSLRFWRIVRGYLPDYLQAKQWLRNNHQLLNL